MVAPMLYLIAGLIAAVFIVLSIRNSRRAREKKILENIRNSWGKAKSDTFHFERIEKYATLSGGKDFHRLSKQTLNDIDFLDLFAFLDRTTSRIGQQFLFNQLLHPTNNPHTLSELNERVNLFANNSDLREDVQKEALRLSGPDAYFVASLLGDRVLQKPGWLPLLYLNVVAVFVLIAFSFAYPVAVVYLLFPIAVNMLAHYWNKSNTFLFFKSFPQLSILIDVSETLAKKNIFPTDNSVGESIDAIKPFQWKMALLGLSQDGSIKDELSQLATYFIELLKAFFAIEIFAIFDLAKELEEKKHNIRILFNYIGTIDGAISIASVRAGNITTCVPQWISAKKEFMGKQMYHPLIKNCVKNDLHVDGSSVLITGSNMSGKTTFLRTIAINSILAQTICTCFADQLHLPMLRQFSSIRIDDSLLEGKSYYYEEVHTMGALIRESQSFQNLFLLDEVFKGTNTIERIASAKAALSYLNRGENIVIVSTHDLELPGMLQREFDLYHFSETVENNQLHFDHKIKAGPLLTGNAIRILEMANYPPEIIAEAKELSHTLSST